MTSITILIPLFFSALAGYFVSEALRSHKEYKALVKQHERNELARAIARAERELSK